MCSCENSVGLLQTLALSCLVRVAACVQVEKRLDLVKQVTHSTHKKLTACLQGQQGTDTEKRSVKSPSVSAFLCDGDGKLHGD